MADTSRTYLQMKFVTAAGADYSISVPYPDPAVTALQIDTVMDTIIAKNVILSAGGALVSKKDAGIIVRSFTDLME